MISSSEGCRIMSGGKKGRVRGRRAQEAPGRPTEHPTSPEFKYSKDDQWEGRGACSRHGLFSPLYFLALGIRVSLVSSSSSSEIFSTRVL